MRLLHHKGQGIITRIIDHQLVEVAIEGDFRIPVLRSEVVAVAKEEAVVFRQAPAKPAAEGAAARAAQPEMPVADYGIYLAFVQNPAYKEAELWLVNNTDWALATTLGSRRENRFVGLWGGWLPGREAAMAHRLTQDQMNYAQAYVLRALYHRPGVIEERQPLLATLKLNAQAFAQAKAKAPVINKEAFLFQADAHLMALPSAQALKDKLVEKPAEPVNVRLETRLVPNEIDLHMEKLVETPELINPNQALKMQLEMFESWLDRAIAANKNEIIFIHGSGSGKLRTEIHKRLARHPHVAFFKDAAKDRFGYGATHVVLK